MKPIIFNMQKSSLSGDGAGSLWPHLHERFPCGMEVRVLYDVPKAQMKTISENLKKADSDTIKKFLNDQSCSKGDFLSLEIQGASISYFIEWELKNGMYCSALGVNVFFQPFGIK